MALAPGTRFGPYEVADQIGVGGMGEVYRATDTKLGREVAIKILPSSFAADADRLARFEREAKMLAALNHAHIAAIYGLDEHDGTQFLAMELIGGETLEEMLKAGALSVDEALRLALQIAEALEAAHEKGVVHRDLKPANVMVTADDQVKVLDFGLAKAFSGNPAEASPAHSPALSMAMTQAGIVLGTAGYMSPEQASGQATDQRADVWAFGVLLYEMLTGLPVFSGESVPHVLAAVLQTEPDWSRLPKNLHPRLRVMLERCLTKKPRDRLHSIADARIEIETAMVEPAVVPETAAVQRSLVPFGVAAALAVFAAAAASWYLKPAEPARVTRFDHELPGTTGFRVLNYPMVAMSADGRRIAYNTSIGVFLLAVDQLDATLIPGTETALANVMLSPDGEWLGYLMGGQLVKLPIGGGGSVPMTEVAPGLFNGATWTDDDWILFAEGSTVLRVRSTGGVPEELFDVPAGQVFLPQMLPDNRAVLFSLQSDTGTRTVIRSLDADEPITSFPGSSARYLPDGYVVYAVDDVLYAQRVDTSTWTPIGGPVPVVDGIVPGSPSFHVAASGSLVYLPAGAGASQDRILAIVSSDGSRQELSGIPPGPYSSPRVSPDGRRLVVQTTDDVPFTTQASRIWVYDLSGDTALRPLTQSGKNFQPIWTPDGQRLTFGSDRDGPVSVYWQAADGSGVPERLTTAETGTQHWPDTWSPDGRILIYQLETGGNDPDLWALSLDAPDEPYPLVVREGRQHGATFSPDGQWFAYSSDDESPGADRIFVQPFPPTGETYQLTRESGAFPVWSADGGKLVYRRGAQATTGEASGLYQVEITRDERFAWRDERRLPLEQFIVFGGIRDYDVLPDGERFVMVFAADNGPTAAAERPRINVVLNWVEELNRRVPVE